MNKREYVKRTISHQTCDKIPFNIILVDEVCDAYGERLLQDFYNKEVMEDYKAGLLTKFQAICLSIGNYLISAPVQWWDWDYNKIPASYQDPMNPPVEMPQTIDYNNYEQAYEKSKFLHDKYGVFTVAQLYGVHWEKAYVTRGIENFLADLLVNAEFAQNMLDFIVDKNMQKLEYIVNFPEYDSVLLGSDWGTQRDLIMPPDTWRDMIKPGEKRQYDKIKSKNKYLFIHSCGNIMRIMDDLVELGVDVLNPVQPECMDIETIKNKHGEKLTFWGGISTQRTLPYGTPMEVRKEVERVTEMMAKNGGYIIGPSQEIQIDVPYENLKALIETARGYS